MAYFFGQTMTRAAVPPEQIAAMNAPTSQLPGMCSGGNKYACQLAQIKEPTEAEKREMALRREQQAAADREATAKRLENVGQGTVAQAVREQKDVEYTAQGPRIIDSGPSFTQVASGIATILSPLAAMGAGIFQVQQQAKLAKQQLKQQQQTTPMPVYLPQAAPASNNTLVIAGLVGGSMLFLVLVVMITRSGSGRKPTKQLPAGRVKRMKRVSRPN